MPLTGMDRPPLPSPDVQAQMGVPEQPPPAAGLSAVRPGGLGPMGRPGGGGAPNPHGFLMAQVDAVNKVLDQMAKAEPGFAPFAQRARAILESGMSAVSSAPKAEGAGPAPTEDLGAGAVPPPPGGAGQLPPLG